MAGRAGCTQRTLTEQPYCASAPRCHFPYREGATLSVSPTESEAYMSYADPPHLPNGPRPGWGRHQSHSTHWNQDTSLHHRKASPSRPDRHSALAPWVLRVRKPPGLDSGPPRVIHKIQGRPGCQLSLTRSPEGLSSKYMASCKNTEHSKLSSVSFHHKTSKPNLLGFRSTKGPPC